MTILASADFNGADGSAFPAGFTNLGPTGFSIKSNRASVNNTSGTTQALYSGITWPADHESEATFAQLTNLSWAAVTVRHPSDSLYYAGGADPTDNGGSNNRRIWKNVSGTRTSLASEAVDLAAGDVGRIRAVGTTITLFINDSQRLSAVDASHAGGSPGFIGRNTVVDSVQLDNWSGRDLLTFGGRGVSRGISRGVNVGVA
jgi:hypothetical protein